MSPVGSFSGRTPVGSRVHPLAAPSIAHSSAGDGFIACPSGVWTTLDTAPYGGLPYGAGRDFVGKYYVAFYPTDFASYNPGSDSWATELGLPFAIGGRGGIMGNGTTKVLCFFSDGTGTAVTQNYHPASVTVWETPLTPMPTPRIEFAFVIGLPDGVHLIGGVEDPGGAFSAVHEVYTVGTDTWSTKASIDTGIGYASGALGPSGDIYLWGLDGLGADVGRVWRKLTDTWEPLPTPPWAGDGRSSLIVQGLAQGGGIIFLVGGGGGGGDSTKFWTYDPVAGVYVVTGQSAGGPLITSDTDLASSEVFAFGAGSDAERFDC